MTLSPIFYSFETSNVFRGLHLLAETATEKVEMSRDIVAAFIGANSSEIVFTSGATESINIVAMVLNMKMIQK